MRGWYLENVSVSPCSNKTAKNPENQQREKYFNLNDSQVLVIAFAYQRAPCCVLSLVHKTLGEKMLHWLKIISIRILFTLILLAWDIKRADLISSSVYVLKCLAFSHSSILMHY